MTRRFFTTVATAATSARLPAAPAAKIRVAMIGTGHGHAASKVRALQSMPEYEFLGVCRPDKDDPAVEDIFRNARWLELDEAAVSVDLAIGGVGVSRVAVTRPKRRSCQSAASTADSHDQDIPAEDGR